MKAHKPDEPEPKRESLTQRREDAENPQRFSLRYLCGSASLRERFCFFLQRLNLLGTLALALMASTIFAQGIKQSSVREGAIKGVVLDADTKSPLVGANVLIVGTPMGAATGANGHFVIANVPIGNYTVRFSYLGYNPLAKTDVIVKPNRTTFLEAALELSEIKMQEVVVTDRFFSSTTDQPTSTVNFSAEEIRRAPGAAGDISRIISGLPSLAKVNDAVNSLMVRGGSPTENGFYYAI